MSNNSVIKKHIYSFFEQPINQSTIVPFLMNIMKPSSDIELSQKIKDAKKEIKNSGLSSAKRKHLNQYMNSVLEGGARDAVVKRVKNRRSKKSALPVIPKFDLSLENVDKDLKSAAKKVKKPKKKKKKSKRSTAKAKPKVQPVSSSVAKKVSTNTKDIHDLKKKLKISKKRLTTYSKNLKAFSRMQI